MRIISATNRDLENAVSSGTFREDLYYRLRVVTITMPALRRRKEDILLLPQYLLARLSREMAIVNPGITEKGVEKLRDHDWPGNIRELSNALKKALIFNRGTPLSADEITFHPGNQPDEGPTKLPQSDGVKQWIRESLMSAGKEKLYDFCLDHVAALLIREALHMSRGNRSNAAKLL